MVLLPSDSQKQATLTATSRHVNGPPPVCLVGSIRGFHSQWSAVVAVDASGAGAAPAAAHCSLNLLWGARAISMAIQEGGAAFFVWT